MNHERELCHVGPIEAQSQLLILITITRLAVVDI